MSGFQKLIKSTPDYTMNPTYFRKGGAVPRQRNLDGFPSRGIIRWKPYAHNLFLNLRILPEGEPEGEPGEYWKHPGPET